jgi:hypothetical protein
VKFAAHYVPHALLVPRNGIESSPGEQLIVFDAENEHSARVYCALLNPLRHFELRTIRVLVPPFGDPYKKANGHG